jgi:ADP-ribose pyrophosphatase
MSTGAAPRDEQIPGDWGPELGPPSDSDRELLEHPVERRLIHAGRIVHLYEEEVRLADGRPALREVVRHPGAVVVIPYDRQRDRLVLVRQYRHPAGRIFLELPAGKLDPGESARDCAARELREETGYTAGHLEPFRSLYTCIGFSNEVLHFFLAEQLTAGQACLDEGEHLHTVELSPARAACLLEEGGLQDAKTVAGLYAFLARLASQPGA